MKHRKQMHYGNVLIRFCQRVCPQNAVHLARSVDAAYAKISEWSDIMTDSVTVGKQYKRRSDTAMTDSLTRSLGMQKWPPFATNKPHHVCDKLSIRSARPVAVTQAATKFDDATTRRRRRRTQLRNKQTCNLPKEKQKVNICKWARATLTAPTNC